MKKALFTIGLLVISQLVWAQIGVGEWRDHLSFKYAIAVTESPQKVYVASESGVFSYSKSSKNVEKFTKANKLSDVGVSSLNYSNENQVLVVGYSNGNVDLVFNSSVFNLSDIKRESISGSKRINNIYFIDEYAYLSCGFGIVVVNLDRKEIKDTYYIGDLGTLVQVNQLQLDNNYLYAATNQGLYIADFTSQNLADFSNWQRVNTIPNYTGEFDALYVSNGEILINNRNEFFNNNLYLYKEGSWNILTSAYTEIRSIRKGLSNVLVVADGVVLEYNTNFEQIKSIESNGSFTMHPYDASTTDDNTYWIADQGYGLIKVTGSMERISPNSPYSSNAFKVAAANDKVVVVAGGITESWANKFINGAYFTFNKEQWTSTFNYEAKDYIDVEIDPHNSNHYFIGAWGHGVSEYLNDELVETYTYSNSSLQTIISGQNYVRIGGLAFDEDNNLWITNSGVSNPISVRKADGNWKSFNYENAISGLVTSDIIVTQNNHKWVVLPNGNGLFVFDNNQTIDNENDDRYKKLSIFDENGKVITNRVYSIAEDLQGEIWVGTDQGIVVYYNPQSVFDDDLFYARRIIVTINDATDYLLKSEVINSIAVDGANRKWIGTQNSGVYLVSKDGTEEIYHFTEENSPLLSNAIYNIGINHESGEVFFATENGLVSYRGSATMGSDEFRDVYVYPNPVRENYTGEITIRGLVSDVNVKITDISGNLVYETTAEGGQATWEGKNFDGKRPSTGVYLVFCTNDDGSKTYITKLLFIK